MSIASCKVLLLSTLVLFCSTKILAQKSYPQIPYSWHVTQTISPYNEAVSKYFRGQLLYAQTLQFELQSLYYIIVVILKEGY
jgi:hypothetical protein